MNLTWHIIKKDLLQLRLPALLSVAILAGQVSVSSLLLSNRSVDLNWFYQMGMFFNLLVAVGLIVTYILVGILILDDPLTGTTMFWLTRPIAGGRLLGAKMVVVLLVFGVLPLLIWLPWWLHCGFGVRDIAVASGYVLGLQAIAVFPAFVLASFVDQLGRFLLLSLLLIFAVWVALLNLATHTGLSHQLMLSRLLVATAFLVPFGLGVIGWQYFSRRTTAAALILVTGVLLSVTVIFWWPVNLSRFWPDHRKQLAGASQISGAISGASISRSRNNGGSYVDSLIIYLRFSGSQEDFRVADGLAAVELRWADGQVIRQEQLKMVLYSAGSEEYADVPLHRVLGLKSDEERWAHHWDVATNAKQAELRAEMVEERWVKYGQQVKVPKDEKAFVTLSLNVSLTPSEVEKIKSDPPACSISGRIGTQRPEVLIEMPLASGMQMAHNGERLHLYGMGRTRRLEKQEPREPDWYTVTAVSATAPSFKNNVILYRVDRNHGVVHFLSSNAAISAMPLAANIACLPFRFEPPTLWRGEKWVEEPDWKESSTLVSVIYRDAGGFDRDFHSDHLIVAKPNSPESAPIQP